MFYVYVQPFRCPSVHTIHSSRPFIPPYQIRWPRCKLLSPSRHQQILRIFEIAPNNAEEERVASSTTATLDLECTRKASDARIVAKGLAATTYPVATAAIRKMKTKAPRAEDIDTLLQILPEISHLRLHFGGLPQKELVKIFTTGSTISSSSLYSLS